MTCDTHITRYPKMKPMMALQVFFSYVSFFTLIKANSFLMFHVLNPEKLREESPSQSSQEVTIINV